MTKHRVSDDEAAELLRGSAPSARPELAPLAESISNFRAAAFESVPQPSAELSARLDLHGAPGEIVSMTPSSSARTAASQQGRVRQMITWFTGLGVLAKILLGSTVAAAAVAGAGVGGVLPGGAQDAFETVVSVVVPSTDEFEPTPAETRTPSPAPTEDTDSSDDADLTEVADLSDDADLTEDADSSDDGTEEIESSDDADSSEAADSAKDSDHSKDSDSSDGADSSSDSSDDDDDDSSSSDED